MYVKPIGNRFTAEVIKEDTTELTESGFLIASNPHSKPMKVKVLEIGDGFDNKGLGLKVGDVVLISKYGSIGIKTGIEQKKYQMCNRMDIIGIL